MGNMERKIKLLAVDDEVQNTKILREIVSFYPRYILQTASSGEECLDILNRFKPDIILLDIMMPGMDGYEVCKEVRKNKNHKYAKIIMVSGLSMVDDRLKAYDAGADDYIAKPFVEEELIAKLDVFSKLSRMEEVDDLKTTALNILSHEARTPLNGMFLALDLLEREYGYEQISKGYLAILRNSSERLKYLLEKISRYCEVKSGLNVSNTEGKIDNFLGKIIESFDCEKNNVKFDIIYEGDLTLVTDWSLFYEIVYEIVENAFKNSPKEGKIKISWINGKKQFGLSIEDEGPGIEEGMRGKIFQSLYSPDVLHHSSGIGLSLAIVEAIVGLLGGNIFCEEAISGGAKFTIKMVK